MVHHGTYQYIMVHHHDDVPSKEKETKSVKETSRTFATLFADINFRRVIRDVQWFRLVHLADLDQFGRTLSVLLSKNPKKMPGNAKKYTGMFLWIVSEIPKIMLEKWLNILSASFLASSGTFFWIVRHLLRIFRHFFGSQGYF